MSSLRRIIIFPALLLALTAAGLGQVDGASPGSPARPTVDAGATPGDAVVAWVEDLPITADELLARMAAERAQTFAYFVSRYGTVDGPGFWTSRHGDESPAAVLRQRALTGTVHIKVQQLLMREHGIAHESSYREFTAAWSAENARRASRTREGERVYGPVAYSQRAYYDDLLSRRVGELKVAMSRDVLAPTEAALRARYERMTATKPPPCGGRLNEHRACGKAHPSFDEARPMLTRGALDDAYTAHVDARVQRARVRIVEPAYARCVPE